MTLGGVVQLRILVGDRGVRCKRARHRFVFLRKLVRAQLRQQREPPVNAGGGRERNRQQRSVRQPSAEHRERIVGAFRQHQTEGPALGDDRFERRSPNRRRSQPGGRRRVKATREQLEGRRAAVVHQAQQRVVRERDFARGRADAGQARRRRALSDHLLRDGHDGGHPLLTRFQLTDSRRKRRADELEVFSIEVLAIELRWRRRGFCVEHRAHGGQNGAHRARLREDGRHAALARQRLGLTLVISGAIEDDRNVGHVRDVADLTHQLVAVHRRHQDVADDQIGAIAVQGSKGIGAIRGFEYPVAGGRQDCRQQLPVDRSILDDQNGSHSD